MRAALSLGCSQIISLGDVVGYYAQPGEFIDLLSAHSAINIMGNHDNYLVSGTNCPRPRLISEIVDYQQQIVSPAQIGWLSRSLSILIEGDNYFAHGSWHDPFDEYLYEISPSHIPTGAKNLMTGHTHVQVLFELGDQRYCNPGSVGQPRDGDPERRLHLLTAVIFTCIGWNTTLTKQFLP